MFQTCEQSITCNTYIGCLWNKKPRASCFNRKTLHQMWSMMTLGRRARTKVLLIIKLEVALETEFTDCFTIRRSRNYKRSTTSPICTFHIQNPGKFCEHRFVNVERPLLFIGATCCTSIHFGLLVAAWGQLDIRNINNTQMFGCQPFLICLILCDVCRC